MAGWRGPKYEGELPTLGFEVLDWITSFLAAPDRSHYEPFVPTQEQAQFVLDFYAVDPGSEDGRRRYRRAVLSRPKGWGKSPLLAAVAAVEALGPVVPDGWDADGEPVGRPWASIRTPWVQMAAVSEDQTRNSWAPLLEMLRDGPVLDEYPGLEPMLGFVNLPGYGRIEFVTSSSTSREGNRPTFCILDQTESWNTSNGGVRLAATIRRNLGKTGGSSIEAPNAYRPGEGSVSESSAEFAGQIAEGRARDTGLLWDHREAPPSTDLADPVSLREGLAYVYGDSAISAGGWVDTEHRIPAEIWDPATHPQDARLFYLNQITAASDSWIAQPEWAGALDLDRVVADGEAVVLGFDGSRARTYSTTDATALIGCTVEGGHIFEVQIWEEPGGAAADGWEVPSVQVDAAVRGAFDRWNVVGFFGDPALWESDIARWEADFSKRLRVGASRQHPISWRIRPRAMVDALAEFHSAVIDGELTHDGSSVLTRHVLNARRRQSRSGVQIFKEFPESPNKIDGAVAAVLAWRARLDAVAAGVSQRRRSPARARVL